jgi:hypothetical protein
MSYCSCSPGGYEAALARTRSLTALHSSIARGVSVSRGTNAKPTMPAANKPLPDLLSRHERGDRGGAYSASSLVLQVLNGYRGIVEDVERVEGDVVLELCAYMSSYNVSVHVPTHPTRQ